MTLHQLPTPLPPATVRRLPGAWLARCHCCGAMRGAATLGEVLTALGRIQVMCAARRRDEELQALATARRPVAGLRATA